MNNLEYLEKIKKADEDLKVNLEAITKNEEGDSYRQAKALEIIAEELCIANKKLTVLVMGKLIVKKCKIKISKDNYEFPKTEVKCPEGFTKKVMDKTNKGEK